MIEYTVKVYGNGITAWYLNGKLHREDGPALIADGFKCWLLDGKLHREDGPAVECADGDKSWYLNDIQITQEEHEKRINPCLNKTIMIDGVEYNLVRKE